MVKQGILSPKIKQIVDAVIGCAERQKRKKKGGNAFKKTQELSWKNIALKTVEV
jgi:hypothetical protein